MLEALIYWGNSAGRMECARVFLPCQDCRRHGLLLGLGFDGFCCADVEDAGDDAADSSGSWSGLKAAYAQLAGVTALPAVRAHGLAD